ncbi:hypothetical protein HDU77_000783, partial [Chytriomyces hyalinus]
QHRRIRKKCKLCTPEPNNAARKYAKRGAKKLARSENEPFSDMAMKVQQQQLQPQFSASCYAVPFGASFSSGETIHERVVVGGDSVKPFSVPTQANTCEDDLPKKCDEVETAPITTTPITVHQQINSSPPSGSNHLKPPLQTATTQSATPLASAKSSPKKLQRSLTMHDFVPVMYHPLQYPSTQIREQQQQQPAYMFVYPGGMHGQAAAAMSTPVLMDMPPGFHSSYFPVDVAPLQQSYWHSASVLMPQGGRGSPPGTPWMLGGGVPGLRASVRGGGGGGVDGISLLIDAAEK